MKALLITSMIIAGSLVASAGYSQVYVNARAGFGRVGFGIRAPRVYYAPAPAPVIYQEGYAPAPVVVGAAYGYDEAAFYGYPAWRGHFRDRIYYDHYRPFVGRYNRGSYHRRW